MGSNTFGTHFQVSTFGESHGLTVGALIDGCPAGVPFSWTLIQEKMDRRRPGRFSWMSSRKEPDEVKLLSGVFEGHTLGTPLVLLVENKDFNSKAYETIKYNPRPGHADDMWKKKFGHTDHRGGGRASGRETVGRVLGGAVAEMFLKQLYGKLNITAFPVQIGPFTRTDVSPPKNKWFGEQTEEVEEFLIQKKKDGLSYGGSIQLIIDNSPSGLGQPVFRKLKSDMAAAFMSIGASYEVSLGKPLSVKGDEEKRWDISRQEGSKLHSKKNSMVYGGIRGGISTGEKIIFHIKFKPPSSVLDVAKKGRHDPCIVPRAAVIVEAMAWLVMADHVLWSRLDRLL